MSLKYKVLDLQEVEEKYKELYQKTDQGEYLLSVIGIPEDQSLNVLKLEKSLLASRNDTKEVKEKFNNYKEQLGNLNPEEISNKLKELEELKVKSSKTSEESELESSEKFQKLLSLKLSPLEKEKELLREQKEQYEKDLETFKQENNNRLINEELIKYASKTNIIPEAIDDLLKYSSDFEITDGKVHTKDLKTIETWLNDYKSKKPHWWPASKGSNSVGSGLNKNIIVKENPFLPGKTWSITDQFQLKQKDPELAARLEKDAENLK